MWLSSNRGLFKYKNDSLSLFTEKDGLINLAGNGDVSIDENGNVILSTYGSGFSIFDGKTFTNI